MSEVYKLPWVPNTSLAGAYIFMLAMILMNANRHRREG